MCLCYLSPRTVPSLQALSAPSFLLTPPLCHFGTWCTRYCRRLSLSRCSQDNLGYVQGEVADLALAAAPSTIVAFLPQCCPQGLDAVFELLRQYILPFNTFLQHDKFLWSSLRLSGFHLRTFVSPFADHLEAAVWTFPFQSLA